MRQGRADTQLFRHGCPVFLQPLEPADEVSQDFPVSVNKPIQLIPVRRGMDAGAAAVLYPFNELLESHLLPHLRSFLPLVERDHPVPRVTHETEFEVALEAAPTYLLPALGR